MTAAGTRAIELVRRAGIDHRVHAYGLEAAARASARDPPGLRAGGRGSPRRSARRADLVEPPVAERATGYVIGGISPLGSRRQLPVVVDAGSGAHATIFVSAGRRGLQLELAPTDLARLTGAIVASITRDY